MIMWCFPGNLLHGVPPAPETQKRDRKREKERKSSELRLTLLVNYWHRRPMLPLCIDYDGTIYAKLRDEGGIRAEQPNRK